MSKGFSGRVGRSPRTAFVLSGGGNQGVSQVGMLRALLERGIVPDVVVGTSVGALNGAVVATNPVLAQVEHLEQVWVELTGERVFPGGTLRRAWNLLRRDDHLISSEGLGEMIDGALVAERFEELTVPLRVVAADLQSGAELVFATGDLRPALLASAALPGIFPPVRLGGSVLVDGAIVNLVPISHALAGPVDRIFVLDVSEPMSDRPIRSPLDVVIRSVAISREQRFELELQWVPPEVELVVLPPPDDDRDFFDFSGARALIDHAMVLTHRALDDHELRPDRQRLRRWWKRIFD
ncbi:MAG: patatin-like phospholipase family protein [Actinomycetota bacterium]